MSNIIHQSAVLYSFRRCPYAMRARMALCNSNIAIELREISLKDKPQSMIKVSSKGTVPVLVLSDGQVIDESIDIMRWALEINDPSRWLDINDELDKSSVLDLIIENDIQFKSHLDHYKYAVRYPQNSMLEYRDLAENFLTKLEELLNNNLFLTGKRASLADIAIFPFIRQFAAVDRVWFDSTHYTQLQRWLNYWLKSRLFNAIMHKHPPWQDGDPAIFLKQSCID